MSIGENIRARRKELGMTQQELADKMGYKSKTTIAKIESGVNDVVQSGVIKFAEVLETSIYYLMGCSTEERKSISKPLPDNSVFEHFSKTRVPLIGGVACGEPIFSEEADGTTIPVPQGYDCDYCMRCHGDSMTGSGIQEGDIVYIKQMPIVENGQIAAVRVEGEYTLKMVYYNRNENHITLVATNPNVPPLSYRNEELEQIEIIGHAVGVLHDLRK